MRKRICVLIMCALLLIGCAGNQGNNTNLSGFENGYQVIDLLDEDAYYKNGKKMAQAVANVIENLKNDGEDICIVEFHQAIISDDYYEQTLNNTGYSYCGPLKNGKPDGYGVLYNYYDEVIEYIGNFEKGAINGYGMKLNGAFIEYEGEFSNGEMANGDVIVPYEPEYYRTEYEVPEDENKFPAIRMCPEYIGEMKKEEYSGKGTLYFPDGTVEYEGEFKNGSYNGDGILYYENGQIQYKGEFSRGKYDGKGTLYDETGNVVFEGKFKKGDYDFN